MSFPADPANVDQSHPKLGSMAIIGHMTAKTCRLWVRLYCHGKWWLVVSKRPLKGDLDTLDGKQVDEFVNAQNADVVFTRAANISGATDNTHTYNVTGLEPDTRYFYAVISDQQEQGRIPRRTEIGNHEKKWFNSQPSELKRISFGFFSCHDPFSVNDRSEGAWSHYLDAMSDRKAVLSIGGGDQVYVDTNDKKDMYSVWKWLARYKKAIIKAYTVNGQLDESALTDYFKKKYWSYYRFYWNFPNLNHTFGRFPHYMIWDDHEIMDGWGSYKKEERKKLLNKWFQDDDEDTNDRLIELMFGAAKQAYFDYQHSHNPKTHIDQDPNQNALCEWDYGFKVGSHAFYVLDMRGHHDIEREGSALLGELQMQRFQKWLATSAKNAKSVFIVSPVPVVHWGKLVSSLDIGPAKDDLRDEWEHETNHAERNKLLDALLEFSHTRHCPVTILSGDVHSASVYQLEHNEKYAGARVFNATSSAISRKPAPGKAEILIRKTGDIENYDGRATRLYALSGEYNFIMVTVDEVDGEQMINLELCWPNGDDGELSIKRLALLEP